MASYDPLESDPSTKGFFEAIGPYEFDLIPTLSFLAIRTGKRWTIRHARLIYNLPGMAITAVPPVTTANLRAGRGIFYVGDTPRDVVRNLLIGTFNFDGWTYDFPHSRRGDSTNFTPLHPSGAQSQARVGILEIEGQQFDAPSETELDWELRDHSQPYDGVADLLREIALDDMAAARPSFLAVAPPPVMIIDSDTRVVGSTAFFHIGLAQGLSRSDVSVGYRVIEQGVVSQRGTIGHSVIQWQQEPNRQRGVFELPVKPAAVVQAFPRWKLKTYQYWWFHDQTRSQNPRRAVFESADPELKVLEAFLGDPPPKESRDVEFAVSWLCWMLGFSPAHFGANKKMTDMADVIVATPQGNYLVIECTIGLLNSNSKLAKLVERTEVVRKNLRLSNYDHARVHPMLVTTKTSDEVRAELDNARRLGIIVLTRDDIPALVNRTRSLPDADTLFAIAERGLQGVSADASEEPELPLP